MSQKEQKCPVGVAECVYWLRRTAPREVVMGAFENASWFYFKAEREGVKLPSLNRNSPVFLFRRTLGDMEPGLIKAYDKHQELQAKARDAEGNLIHLPDYDIHAEIADRFVTYVRTEWDRINAPVASTGKR